MSTEADSQNAPVAPAAVEFDPYDPRDMPFSALDDDSTELPKHVRKEWEAENRRAVEVHPEYWCVDYRDLADTTWHQRGEECTGFALSAIADYHFRRDYIARGGLSASQWRRLPVNEREQQTVSRRMMYEMAQVYDRQSFVTGSTLRGALKGWRDSGVASAKIWPYEPDDEEGEKHGKLGLKRVVDSVARPGGCYFRVDKADIGSMKLALARNYPLFASARHHTGWFELYLPTTPTEAEQPAPDGGLELESLYRELAEFDPADSEPTSEAAACISRPADMKLRGGHAFVIVGYDRVGWRIHNSWGSEWGDRGYAVLPFEDWAEHGQDVWFVFPPLHREQRLVTEDEFLPGSPAARTASGLTRAEAGLATAESKAAVAECHVDASGADPTASAAAADKSVDDVERAWRELIEARREADHTPDRAELHSTMWRHMITLGDDGRLLPVGTRYGMNHSTLKTLVWMFRRQSKDWSRRRLAIFADGGYWATPTAVEQLRPLRDALMAAEIYPIFLLWDTPWYTDMQGWLYGTAEIDPPRGGAGEEGQSVPEAWGRALSAGEDDFMRSLGLGWLLEAGMKMNAAEFPAPRMWRQMVRRTQAACGRDDGGGRLLVDSVHYNRTKAAFEIHLIGHGVGELLLQQLASMLPPVTSCNLWAPASTMDGFRTGYAPMLESRHLRHLTVHALDDTSELADSMGPLRGSPLKLISDVLAVEDLDVAKVFEELKNFEMWSPRPEPVLGMQRYLNTDDDVERLIERDLMATKFIARPSLPPWSSAHTSLLTDAEVHGATIESILAGSAAVTSAEGSSLPPPARTAQRGTPPAASAVRPAPPIDTLTGPDPLSGGMF
ncbi:MAG: C1 family peptidase [Ilumatobacteraceae bacterium]